MTLTNEQIQARAERIIAEMKIKHGGNDSYAPVILWSEFLSLLAEREADKALIAESVELFTTLRDRIDELEARTLTVMLPKTFWYEHDDLSRDVAVLEKRLVKKALHEACADAGITLVVGGE